MTKQKIKALEVLASDMVGDSKKPNLFFVSVKGVIITITRSFEIAYQEWQTLSYNNNQETSLEDRQTGTLATLQPKEDNSKQLEKIDDTHWMIRKGWICP